MEGFPGVESYQKYCRMAVMRDGYILMNPQTRHRAHIPELKFIREMQEKVQNPEFWSYYREMKRDAPECETVRSVSKFFGIKSQCEKNSINYRMEVSCLNSLNSVEPEAQAVKLNVW